MEFNDRFVTVAISKPDRWEYLGMAMICVIISLTIIVSFYLTAQGDCNTIPQIVEEIESE